MLENQNLFFFEEKSLTEQVVALNQSPQVPITIEINRFSFFPSQKYNFLLGHVTLETLHKIVSIAEPIQKVPPYCGVGFEQFLKYKRTNSISFSLSNYYYLCRTR